MSEKKFGRIINITSVVGLKGAFGQTNYSASKAGIIGFTKSLSLELAAKNITVNAIAPGIIDTDMIKKIPKEYLKKMVDEIPLRQIGHPEDVANLCAFLLSDKANYITGQVISVNGGMY
jgi:3-oxoacyl-[acyl-carrier protein] reductase